MRDKLSVFRLTAYDWRHLRLSRSYRSTRGKMAKQAAVLLLCTAHALMVSVSALPSHWSSFYYDQRALAGRQQQQAAMCDASAVSPPSLTCKSARLVVPGGNITHIHVCPSDSKFDVWLDVWDLSIKLGWVHVAACDSTLHEPRVYVYWWYMQLNFSIKDLWFSIRTGYYQPVTEL